MVPGARLVVLGKQGAGKGTQCVRLSHHYVVPHVSTGDMLRAAVKEGTALGEKAKDIMDRGELLGDDLIMEMVTERLQESDVRARGFVLDGCPRTVGQAERLAKIVVPLDLDLAIDIEIDTPGSSCDAWPPAGCASTAGPTTRRPTPRSSTGAVTSAAARSSSGRTTPKRPSPAGSSSTSVQTAPLIAWYEERNQLAKVAGTGTPDAVTRRMIRAIEQRRQRQVGL